MDFVFEINTDRHWTTKTKPNWNKKKQYDKQNFEKRNEFLSD